MNGSSNLQALLLDRAFKISTVGVMMTHTQNSRAAEADWPCEAPACLPNVLRRSVRGIVE